MKRIENFKTKKAYANGFSDAELEEEFDLRWKICELPRNIFENENGISDKIDSDNETEINFVNKGTRKPSTRGERRKATAKAKRKAKRNEPFTYSLVDHGEYVIHKGNTYAWHPEWKKIDRRIRRHEGKTLCFNYEAEDATEIEFDLEEDYEALERQECIEWLQSLEDEVYSQDLKTETELNEYEAFLSEFNLWTLFNEWKKRKGE